MALTFSTGYKTGRLREADFNNMFEGGELQIWSGSAPSVDSAATGTRLATITVASGTRTAETSATFLLTVGGASGSLDTLTVDGYPIIGAAVAFNTSTTQTAADIATAINKYRGVINCYATSSAAVVTCRMAPGIGTGLNGVTVAHTETTLTATINGGSSTTVGGAGATAGVASVNGLTWGEVVAGVIVKTGTWSGVVDNGGTAGYFRLEGCTTVTDVSDAHSTASPRYRIQGTCGTTGADYNMSSTSLTASTTHTVDTFQLTAA